MKINILDFDSNLFGCKVAKIDLIKENNTDELKDIIYHAQKQGLSLLYVHTTDNIKLNGIQVKSSFCEERIIYRKDSALFNKERIDNNIQSYSHNFVSKALREIAIEAAEFSRFRLDKNFREDDYINLYEKWIIKSVHKELSTDVIVYYDLDIERAFIAYKESGNICNLSLIAVHHGYRGKQIAVALIEYLEYIMPSQIDHIDICTQISNKAACNLYSKLNYRVFSTEKIYHLWL